MKNRAENVLAVNRKTEFPDFANIKDFPWLFKKFPDFSLTLKNFLFLRLFPDRGNPVQGSSLNFQVKIFSLKQFCLQGKKQLI